MSMNSVLTEPSTLIKLFKWTIGNFNEFNEYNMKEERCKEALFIESPKLTAIDPFNGKEFTAIFKLSCTDKRFRIIPTILPEDSYAYDCYFYINGGSDAIRCGEYNRHEKTDDIETLRVFVDVYGYRSSYVSPFKRVNPSNLGDRLKEMWKNDSSNKFTIKCHDGTSFETFKPILASRSLFFKDMFAIENMTENSVPITDFEVGVVQKMVEFCETDDIKNCNGFEDGLFKIAHKFQISDLMDFAVEKMSENANSSNIQGYLKLAIDYKLKDFEEWCKNFGFRRNTNFE